MADDEVVKEEETQEESTQEEVQEEVQEDAPAPSGDDSEDVSLINKSAVYKHIKAGDMNVSGDIFPHVSTFLGVALDRAAARAKSNGRKTVREGDL